MNVFYYSFQFIAANFASSMASGIDLTDQMKPHMSIKAIIHREDGTQSEITLISRIDTLNELDYYKSGGILQHVLRGMLKT